MSTRNERSREIVKAINISVIEGLHCPKCKQPELNEKTGLLNFRGLKVMDNDGYWWSHCLTCDTWF